MNILSKFDSRFVYSLYRVDEIIGGWGGPMPEINSQYRGIYNSLNKTLMIADKKFDGVYIKCLVTKISGPDNYYSYIEEIKITPDTSLSTTAE